MDLGEPVTLEELGQKPGSEGIEGDYRKYMESCIQGVLKVNNQSHNPLLQETDSEY